MTKKHNYTRDDFHSFVAAPIDSWIGLHPLSAVQNREGGFCYATDEFVHEVVSICNELREGLGTLRHEPYLAFEPLLPEQYQPRLTYIYLKEDKNGLTHIFSTTPLGIHKEE